MSLFSPVKIITGGVTALLLLSSASAFADPLHVVAAENFYGGVAAQIAGTDAVVTSILTNPNQDPHEFTTSAATARAVADADLIIYNGIDYDPWMDKLLAAQDRPGRIVICVANLIGAGDGDNPHVWYDPRIMPALAEKLAAILSQRDPDQAATCERRLADFKSSLQPELKKIAEIKAAAAGTEVTATEPVFGYMATALGFKMLNYDFQVKIMNDADPSVAETAAFEKTLTTRKARILFYNSQVTDPTTERLQKIALQSGIPIVGVTETQPLDEKDYASWMERELQEVQAALARKNP